MNMNVLLLTRGIKFEFKVSGLPVLDEGKKYRVFLRNYSLSWKEEASTVTVGENNVITCSWGPDKTKAAPIEKLNLEICDEDFDRMYSKVDFAMVANSSVEKLND